MIVNFDVHYDNYIYDVHKYLHIYVTVSLYTRIIFFRIRHVSTSVLYRICVSCLFSYFIGAVYVISYESRKS